MAKVAKEWTQTYVCQTMIRLLEQLTVIKGCTLCKQGAGFVALEGVKSHPKMLVQASAPIGKSQQLVKPSGERKSKICLLQLLSVEQPKDQCSDLV